MGLLTSRPDGAIVMPLLRSFPAPRGVILYKKSPLFYEERAFYLHQNFRFEPIT